MATFSKPTRKTIPAKTGGAQRNQAIKLPISVPPILIPNFSPTHLSYLSKWHHGDSTQKNRSMTTIHQLLLCRSHTLCSLDKPTGMPSASKSKVVVQPNGFCFSKSPATFLVFFCEWWEGILIYHIWKCLEMFGVYVPYVVTSTNGYCQDMDFFGCTVQLWCKKTVRLHGDGPSFTLCKWKVTTQIGIPQVFQVIPSRRLKIYISKWHKPMPCISWRHFSFMFHFPLTFGLWNFQRFQCQTLPVLRKHGRMAPCGE